QFNRSAQFNRSQAGEFANRTMAGGSAKVTVTFKDEQNQAHTVTEDVRISATSTVRTTSSTFTPRSAGNGGILFGLDAIQLGGIALVLVAGYILYRRRKKKQVIEE
ncbi:MAG: hypothetical protein ABIF01_00540, partial [Candidatus Micrarchaeota archaeon]